MSDEIESRIVEWRAKLLGEPMDLEDFPLWTDGCSFSVRKIGEDFFLCLPTSLAGEDRKIATRAVPMYVDWLNGIGSLLFGAYEAVRWDGMLKGYDDQGNEAVISLRLTPVSARLKVGYLIARTDGVLRPDPRIGAAKDLVRAAERKENGARALALLAQIELTWPQLFVLYEIVKGSISDDVVAKGWISKNDLRDFKRTCGSYEAIGIHARHGPQHQTPPEVPMERAVAIQLIRRLTLHWLVYEGQ